MNTNIKICFLADRHDLFDERIYWKMAVPLKERGFDVYYFLIGSERKKGKTKEGIFFEQLLVKQYSQNLYLNFILKRLGTTNNYKELFRLASGIKADIYHFHDLWINLIAKKLKLLNHKPVVFYDVREPHSDDLVSFYGKNSISKRIVRIFAHYVDKWEKNCSKEYDLVIATEENVGEKFRKILKKNKVEVLHNFTNIYNNYKNYSFSEKEYDFIYCGGITALRGAFQVLDAAKITVNKIPKVKILLLGKFSPSKLKNELQEVIIANKLERNIYLYDSVSYKEVSDFYNKSKIGLITWLPVKALSIKMPIKIFEYMAFGLPIIGSNFGHIKDFIEKVNCGKVVNPEKPVDISNAMVELLTNDKIYNLYSKNGRNATLMKFKWENEFDRLVGFYTKALDERKSIK